MTAPVFLLKNSIKTLNVYSVVNETVLNKNPTKDSSIPKFVLWQQCYETCNKFRPIPLDLSSSNPITKG